jgi:hypothetical protein
MSDPESGSDKISQPSSLQANIRRGLSMERTNSACEAGLGTRTSLSRCSVIVCVSSKKAMPIIMGVATFSKTWNIHVTVKEACISTPNEQVDSI